MSTRRLGLFGGTFDPPHLGHVAALRAAWATGEFDEILVTVAGDPYQKSRTDLTPAPLRLAMAWAAFSELPGVEVSDLEIRRAGPSYTVTTVRQLVAEGNAVTLLVGADVLATLNGWHEAPALRELVRLAVFPRREGASTLPEGWRGSFLPMEPVDLSSTETRTRLKNGENPAQLVPLEVIPWLSEPSE